ncbi:MAG: wax ester/triacylglycerol synthase family O-acyltransferase [Thermoleophilaceae bacterium]|nr:wax ester/triacylglycerol synthase family O-acyltransferase [Thermoleophilaceae bacterium]
MSQRELSRLSATDASFLVQERHGSHMHIGGLMVFEGPMPDIDVLKAHIRSRLHLVPRYRQRLVWAPLEAGRPFWADDPEFNLSYHVRDAALPAPGNDEQLELMAARIFSQRLDRDKPLWEMWLIDGLAGGRFGMILKTHHAVIDGIAGVDVGTVLLGLEPTTDIDDPQPWRPGPFPTGGELLEIGLRDASKAPGNLARRAINLARGDGDARAELGEFLNGATKAVTETIDAAPRTPLNGPITQHRRFKIVRNSLDDFKEIKTLLDTTLNDVVLTVTSDALGRWLRSRYYPTDGLKLRALVPVSTRPKAKRGASVSTGNELLAMRGYLPVEEMETLKRLNYIKNSMDGLKRNNQAVAADALTAVQNFAPPTILAQASRLNFSTRLFNLLVTNVPGPQMPLYLLDRPMVDAFPIPFLAENHTVAIAVMSYHGRINFGILGDYDAVPDIQVIADGLSDARDDLLDATSQVKNKVREVMRSGTDVSALADVAEGAAKTAERTKAKRTAKTNGAVKANGAAKTNGAAKPNGSTTRATPKPRAKKKPEAPADAN